MRNEMKKYGGVQREKSRRQNRRVATLRTKLRAMTEVVKCTMAEDEEEDMRKKARGKCTREMNGRSKKSCGREERASKNGSGRRDNCSNEGGKRARKRQCSSSRNRCINGDNGRMSLNRNFMAAAEGQQVRQSRRSGRGRGRAGGGAAEQKKRAWQQQRREH